MIWSHRTVRFQYVSSKFSYTHAYRDQQQYLKHGIKLLSSKHPIVKCYCSVVIHHLMYCQSNQLSSSNSKTVDVIAISHYCIYKCKHSRNQLLSFCLCVDVCVCVYMHIYVCVCHTHVLCHLYISLGQLLEVCVHQTLQWVANKAYNYNHT